MARGDLDRVPPSKFSSLKGVHLLIRDFHQEPITVNVKLPDYSAKPEWKLDGSTVPIPEVTLSTLVSTLRDRIIGQIGSTVPFSRMRLQMGTITLSNSKTLAFYNIQEGEEVSFELREVKKR